MDKETLFRIQKLVMGNKTPGTLVRAAAYKGDLEVVQALHEEFGSDLFVSKDSKGLRTDAIERAAEGNQVDAIKWILERGVLPEVHHVLGSPLEAVPSVGCRAAVGAAIAGAFEAVELIGEQLPVLKEREIGRGMASVHYVRINAVGVREEVKFERFSFLGLLLLATAVAQKKGRDTVPLLEKLDVHLNNGLKPDARDMKMAMELGSADLFTRLLQAGGMMPVMEFGRTLDVSTQPIAMLRALNDHLNLTKKKFQNIFCGTETPPQPYRYASFTATGNTGNFPVLAQFMVEIGKLAGKASVISQNERADRARYEPQALADELLRLFKAVMPDAICTDMLAQAVAHDCLPLARRLMEEGVNPGASPQWRDASEERGRAPIHRCKSADMLRLLHQFGADVNQPLSHKAPGRSATIDGNLFTHWCTDMQLNKPEMLFAFVECGGDLGRKFSGMTVAQLSSKCTDAFKHAIKSVKSGAAVTRALEQVAPSEQEAAPRARTLQPL